MHNTDHTTDLAFQAKRLLRWNYQSIDIYPTLYGFTKNETTRQYHLVLKYFEEGDLRKQLQHQATDWEDKIKMIYEIAINMKTIHDAGMIHR